jgi:hypothetical protein
MNQFEETPAAKEPKPIPRARRRRARRTFFPKDAEGRAALLATLSRRAYPSFDLFIFSLLGGAVLGLGYILDSQGLLFFGVLLAPLMIPWVGLTLATISGTPRLFLHTMSGLIISAVLVFLTGALAGLASRVFQEPLNFTQAFLHSRLWIPDLVVLAFGAALLTASFVRSEEKPYLPSALIAYELFLPLSTGGFGLGSGIGNIWPHGILVFLVHFAWASLFSMATLLLLRFRPLSIGGYGFAAGVAAIFAFTFFWLTNSEEPHTTVPAQTPTLPTASAILPSPPSETSTLTPSPSETLLPKKPTETETALQETPDTTLTPMVLEITLPVTETRTNTPNPEPTPIYAIIRAREGGGAYIRKEPGGKVLATLDNGAVVQVLPETQELNGMIWIHITATINDIRVDGWIIQSVLETATPVPVWEPSITPTP